MTPTDDRPDDEDRLAALLRAAERDAPPPDPAVLAGLRDRSTQAFLDQAAPTPVPPQRRLRPMHTTLLRLSAVAAVLAVVTAGVWYFLAPAPAADQLGPALDRAAAARTLHLRLVRGGRPEEVWVRRPGRWRIDDAGGTYRIGDADRCWYVDESANKAFLGPMPPFARGAAGADLDLLTLIGVPADTAPAVLRDRKPDGRAERDGVECLVYRFQVADPAGPVAVEAFVDAATGLPHALEARRPGQAALLAELVVLAVNQPVAEEKFALKPTLTEDGRVGVVADVQGTVAVKPVLHDRWTPVAPHTPLKPGDWVRTDLRGANACALKLVPQATITIGPGSQVEVVKPDQLRLLAGEVEVAVPPNAPVKLVAPDQPAVTLAGVTRRYRLDDGKLAEVAQVPGWLKGFKGATASESIGSLIAKVDGRDVPLSVGYHKVSVEIRDQIARTTIEESFVNHTDALMEGSFLFPLPQEASIAGFGMWIGDDLVEADVVEKQRAREIYETILREKRDPGLLEWSGGNLFKARVYPIFAHSEKRVKITYTQVLPLVGNRYRYSYALQSELLKQHPLRELAMDVTVSSAAPLKAVSCPTHACRINSTPHAAKVEFSAQEYTPTRDFEVVAELDGKQPEVALLPHRRGDDGYFLLQLTPPGELAAGGAEGIARDILPNGEPLELLVLCDTSASIDASQRKTQDALLAGLLGALTPRDRFNLATLDVTTDWAFAQPQPADPASTDRARMFLARRTSLGWTDLERAFAAALGQCSPRTHVVYLGDGVGTAGDPDPAALARKLRQVYEQAGGRGTCHAVSLGSLYDPTTMQAIASLGGGSVRKVSGDQGPQAVALELLGEIARPTVRDLKVEFTGLRTARVYPERLPNLPAGTQQVLLGRYLPEGKNQTGEVVVTGTQGGKPVRWTAKVTLPDGEAGNSFIPRLWARMHLDRLLEQGGSDAVKDEVIALSEEFHIMTPYTSLLVLETDADRERFGVKRRFQMRDGEKFFAEGRDKARTELLAQQMKRAGEWRVGLRRAVLARLAGLGRDVPLPGVDPRQAERWKGKDDRSGFGGGGFSPDGRRLVELGDAERLSDALGRSEVDGDEVAGRRADRGGEVQVLEQAREEKAELALSKTPYSAPLLAISPAPGQPAESAPADETPIAGEKDTRDQILDRELDAKSFKDAEDEGKLTVLGTARLKSSLRGLSYGFEPSTEGLSLGLPVTMARRSWPDSRLRSLFPDLPAAPPAVDPASTWPEPARALARSLLRTESLAKLDGGLVIVRQTDGFDPRWGEHTSRTRQTDLVSPRRWLVRTEADAAGVTVEWCDGAERGVLNRHFQLGRRRAATPQDLRRPPLGLADHSLSPLDLQYPHYPVKLEDAGAGRKLLVVTYPHAPQTEVRFLIDPTRRVILSVEQRTGGKVGSVTKYDDFIEAGGSWWARTVETADDKGRVLSRVTQTVTAKAAADAEQVWQQAKADRGPALVLRGPLLTVLDAKKAAAAGKATPEDQFVLLAYFTGSQQWARVAEHLEALEKLSPDKPGVRWLHDQVLNVGRQHGDLPSRLLQEAKELAARPAGDTADAEALALADHLLDGGWRWVQADELLPVLDALKPVYERQPAYRQALKRWALRRVELLQQTGEAEAAVELLKKLATDHSHDHSLQYQYAQALAAEGDANAALAWLDRCLADARWSAGEEESLRTHAAQILEREGRLAELRDYLAKWVGRDPESMTPYHHYLAVLERSGREAEFNDLLGRWLRDGSAAGASPAARARLTAAVRQALGWGHHYYSNEIDPRWLRPLAEVVLTLARQPGDHSDATSIVQHRQFRTSDAGRRLFRELADELARDLDRMNLDQIAERVAWQVDYGPPVSKPVTDGLRKRWAAETDPERRHRLGLVLWQAYGNSGRPGDRLAFLREELRSGPERYRAAYARQLFAPLMEQPWTAEVEAELFAVVPKLSDADDAGTRLAQQVRELYRLTDRLVAARSEAALQAVANPEKLTRTELAKLREKHLKEARAGVADRLRQEAARQPKPLADWLTAERTYLDFQAERDRKQVATDCWALVDALPVAKTATNEPTVADRLTDVLRQRLLTTLTNLAVRTGADPAQRAKLDQYLDRGAGANPPDPLARQLRFWQLVALDRPQELEQLLRGWARRDENDPRWPLMLGYLAAEQGKVAEAIRLFEAVEKAGELSPAAWRTLSDWYLVEGRKDDAERAKLAAFQATPEQELARWLQLAWYRVRRTGDGVPGELDPDAPRVVAVLLGKATRPEQYTSTVQQLYQVTHDPRLLAGLADALAGLSPGGAIPFLGSLGGVVGEIRDEATVDELVGRIERLRAAAPPADRRALDLLEVAVRRRAAELKNQPGPHVAAALAALDRSARPEGTPVERRLLADFLAGLGHVTNPDLAKAQIARLEALHAAAAKGSLDRLQQGTALAKRLTDAGRRDAGIDLLSADLAEFQESHPGTPPTAADFPLSFLVGLLQQATHYDRAERLVLAQIERSKLPARGRHFTEELFTVYVAAYRSGGAVSLGAGDELYAPLQRRLIEEFAARPPNLRQGLFSLLSQFYQTAHQRKAPAAADDLRAFAFGRLPKLLGQGGDPDTDNQFVGGMAQLLHDLIGPREGIALLLDRVDHEPAWLARTGRGVWGRQVWTLASWRSEAKDLGPLEGPLLRQVVAQLRRDLEAQSGGSRPIYDRRYGYFWEEKADVFARTAEDVLARHEGSAPEVLYVAEYLFQGLARQDRTIAVLQAANGKQLLDPSGQLQLVTYLHQTGRYSESVPLLEPLVRGEPDDLSLRVLLMRAYHHSGRDSAGRALALLKETDARFRKSPLWGLDVLATLAESCRENGLYPEGVAYYKELIPQYERSRPGGGIGDGRLSNFYAGLAQCHAGLKQTPEAVEAASAAVVAWGPDRRNRQNALNTLRQVIGDAPDLDGFVRHLDKQAAETGADKPLIRRMVGQVYVARNQLAAAQAQLRLAAELQPEDTEARQALVECLDKQGDREGAAREVLAAAQLFRRDVQRYRDLGRRLGELNQPEESERAYTSIVEVLPSEAESHALFAEVRQGQNRWPEAIRHWRRVAKLRALEPTGLLKLAAAQVHERQWDDAAATLRTLRGKQWPDRFGNVGGEIGNLERQVEEGRRR
jgi:tetratricopeptide (TPR) repeat protein